MLLLDANVILRYLLKDDLEMAICAKEIIENRKDAFVTTEVIGEVIYVLKGVYSLERGEIARSLIDLMNLIDTGNEEVIILALEVFGKTNLDFVDCVLFAYHKLLGFEIATFDKKLINLMTRENKF